VSEFHQLWEEDWFEGCKPMLVNGEIYLMAIPGPLHNRGVGLVDYALRPIFGDGFWIRVQMPLVLGQHSDPVPDIAVVTGSPRTLVTQPTSAELVVEVADTSLSIDLGQKAKAYATAGIADYWVVDLNNRALIVHRGPRPDRSSASGSSYVDVAILTAGQSIAPLAAPTAMVGVGDLLP
jgi:Uma2 family endonuclease